MDLYYRFEPVQRAAERFERYREGLLRLKAPLEVRGEAMVRSATCHGIAVGPVHVASQVIAADSPIEQHRTRALIRRSDPEAFRLLLNVRGALRLDHGSRQEQLSDGEIMLIDTSQPFASRRPGPQRSALLLVTIPRGILDVPENAVRAAIGSKIRCRPGVLRPVLPLLGELAHDLRTFDALQPGEVAETLTTVMEGMLREHLGLSVPATAATVRRLRASAYLQRHHAERVDPRHLADHLGICVRTLYHLFDSETLTPMRRLDRIRLNHARRLIADPACTDSLEQIAHTTGLGGQAQLSRRFKATFGVSPSSVRPGQRQPGGDR